MSIPFEFYNGNFNWNSVWIEPLCVCQAQWIEIAEWTTNYFFGSLNRNDNECKQNQLKSLPSPYFINAIEHSLKYIEMEVMNYENAQWKHWIERPGIEANVWNAHIQPVNLVWIFRNNNTRSPNVMTCDTRWYIFNFCTWENWPLFGLKTSNSTEKPWNFEFMFVQRKI